MGKTKSSKGGKSVTKPQTSRSKAGSQAAQAASGSSSRRRRRSSAGSEGSEGPPPPKKSALELTDSQKMAIFKEMSRKIQDDKRGGHVRETEGE